MTPTSETTRDRLTEVLLATRAQLGDRCSSEKLAEAVLASNVWRDALAEAFDNGWNAGVRKRGPGQRVRHP